jgi:hypothetical protein
MYIGLHVKCRLLLSNGNVTRLLLTNFRKITNFMKIRPVGFELFRADRRTDKLYKGKSRFSQFCKKRLKTSKPQWSLYVPYSGHYMYRTVVTICTVQWSLYVPHSSHYMYRTVVTICTTSLTFTNSMFCPHSVFVCFVWISEQTAFISLYSINWLVL